MGAGAVSVARLPGQRQDGRWKAMTWLAGDRTEHTATGSSRVGCSCGPEQGFPEEGTNHRFPNHVLLVIASARSVRKPALFTERNVMGARVPMNAREMSCVRVCP